MKKTLIACLLIAALLMALPSLRVSRAETDPFAYSIEAEGPVAENLTHHCRLTSDLKSTAYTWRLTDADLNSSQILKDGQRVTLTWREGIPVKTIWMAFKDYPAADSFTFQQFDREGTLLKEVPGSWYVNQIVSLEEGTRSISVVSKSEINLCSLYAYGEGVIPSYHPWEPTPEKLDYLIVAMHPDDDVLFMGAIVPLYTVEQGWDGSIFYAATRERVRKDEAGNGAWIMGLRKAPILGTFPDIPPSYREQHQDTFQQKDMVRYLVRLFRQYRPEVVFSHDLNGEYGHWQHVILANAVLEAVPLAADSTYDKKSAAQYGTWEIKKLYLHLYPENPIQLPATKAIDAYGGLTPVEIATAAFQCHRSQLPSRHAVRNEGVYSLSDFGLAYTTVGLDTPSLNDPFEHIEAASFYSSAGPASTDMPVPTDTSAPADAPTPTDTPVPEDTSAPADASTPTDTPVPEDTPAPADTPMPTDTPVPEDTLVPADTPAPTDVPASQETAAAHTPAPEAPDPEASAPAETPADPEEASFLSWLLPLLIGIAAILCLSVSFLTKHWWQRILLWLFALLLSLGAALMLVNERRPQVTEPAPTASTAPTAAPVCELSFTTETLPEPAALAPTWYEAIRQAVPADCQILWAIPLTDGRFPCDSTELVLPHFSPEDGQLLSYFEQLSAIDASGSTAYDALLSLMETRPDLSLTFTLVVGDQVLTMADEALTVREAPDFQLLEKGLAAFPRLRVLDLTEATIDPADVMALSGQYPDLTVSYTVPVGDAHFPVEATSIALANANLPNVDELLFALPYLPELQTVDLHGTALGLEDVLSVQAARPELKILQTVDLLGQKVETDAAELDLRNASCSVQELIPLLRAFSALKKVYLPEREDTDTAVAQLQSEHPETVFVRRVTVFGQVMDNAAEELDVSKTVFKSPEAVLSEIAQLPYLKKLIMCDCGLSNEQMEVLMAARPDVKFVWTIHLRQHAIRTDAIAFSTKNPSKYTQSYYSDAMNNRIKKTKRLKAGDLKDLKYCTDLLALDLGHNYLTNEDLEVLQYLPHLQLLILADNKITDISALSCLQELQYVELFMNNIPDVSPLVGLPHLTDINIANIHLEDVTPLLQFTQAKRLWFSMNGLSAAQNQAVIDALPSCVCNCTTRDETGDGWREGERYQWLRSFFYDN